MIKKTVKTKLNRKIFFLIAITTIIISCSTITELTQEENYIEGRYQFDTEEFIGRLTGTLEGDIIKFSYYWIDGKHQGSGIFHVSSDGQYLEGNYFQSIEIDNLSMQDYENLRNTWSFSKHS